jgi:uncharacterized RDD family membrane protein YckC
MHKIVLASLGKRALTAVLDAIIAFIIGIGVFALSQAAFLGSKTAKNYADELTSYQVDSGLYYVNTDGNATSYEFNNYVDYQNKVFNFYTVYLVSGCPEAYRNPKYTTYWYNVFILGQDDVKNLYSDDQLKARENPSLSLGKTYFAYDGTNYDALAKPVAGLYADGNAEGSLTEDAKSKLEIFYYSPTSQSVYYNAAHHLANQTFFAKANDNYEQFAKVYPLLISIGVAYLICYFAVPLITHNGQTLGKLFMRLCLINNHGFKIKRSQVVIRSLPTLVLLLIFAFFFGSVYGSIVSLAVLLVSYILVLFTKNHQAIHDYIAMTWVIDSAESVFFKNIEEQEAVEDAYQKEMQATDKLKESCALETVSDSVKTTDSDQ